MSETAPGLDLLLADLTAYLELAQKNPEQVFFVPSADPAWGHGAVKIQEPANRLLNYSVHIYCTVALAFHCLVM